MQPYFLPYIGYWQLLNAVDKFVIYDNIQYTKKGWINRNRYLFNGKPFTFTIPIKNDSDFLDIKDRRVAYDLKFQQKILNKIKPAYSKKPYFKETFPIIEDIVNNNQINLFEYIYYSINKLKELLGINTEIIISSSIKIDHSLKSQDKVLAICKELKADRYINAIGGKELYSKEEFSKENIELFFIETNKIEYDQFQIDFVPYLSILDMLMFVGIDKTKEFLTQYKLV